MPLTIYHNPRCSKSRQTLTLIEAAGQEPMIVKYLEDPLSADVIAALLSQLGFADARKLMRTGEADYKAAGLKEVTDNQALIKAMAENPKLIERPIVSNGEKAILGRPPENVDALL
ncbi:MAG: arsenate reductase (glutaredoxin) [Maricaulaceae bacterium]